MRDNTLPPKRNDLIIFNRIQILAMIKEAKRLIRLRVGYEDKELFNKWMFGKGKDNKKKMTYDQFVACLSLNDAFEEVIKKKNG